MALRRGCAIAAVEERRGAWQGCCHWEVPTTVRQWGILGVAMGAWPAIGRGVLRPAEHGQRPGVYLQQGGRRRKDDGDVGRGGYVVGGEGEIRVRVKIRITKIIISGINGLLDLWVSG